MLKQARMGDEDNWKTAEFRQKVITKFEEKINDMETKPARSANELEQRVS